MRTRLILQATMLLTLLAGSAQAASQVVVQEAAAEGHAPIRAQLADLAWMAGAWKGPGLGGVAEEHWTRPSGGSMLGMFRLVNGKGKASVFELILIEQVDDQIVYRFRHFGPGHKPWEPPDKPLTFDLVRLSANEALFESNVQTDPKRLTYRRDDDKLQIRVQGEENGELQPGFLVKLEATELDDDGEDEPADDADGR